MSKKLTIEYVRESFELEGYTLLSNEYINNRTKLEYRCNKGHRHSINWAMWNSGDRCPYCSKKIKLTLDEIRSSFESDGYTLISDEYKNNKQKLNFICPNGSKHSIRWNDWQQGHRCICSLCDNRIKVTISEIRSEFEKEGYTLLSGSYKNIITKLNYVCPNGHKHSISWHDWQQGHRCPCYVCQIEKYTKIAIAISGPGHPNWQGGKSFEQYCEAWKDKEYKKDIRNRDENRCLNPYCNSPDPSDLTIHHINYDKKDCRPSNLITVCRSCNSKANYNRKWHQSWYQTVLKNRYNIGVINHEQRT